MIVSRGSIGLHAQIVQQLRYRIAAGLLLPGARLPSARKAAREWGVNFHTVRRAYRELASLELVEIDGARGTQVANAKARLEPETGIATFIDELIARSNEDLGISSRRLSHVAIPARCRAYATALT